MVKFVDYISAEMAIATLSGSTVLLCCALTFIIRRELGAIRAHDLQRIVTACIEHEDTLRIRAVEVDSGPIERRYRQWRAAKCRLAGCFGLRPAPQPGRGPRGMSVQQSPRYAWCFPSNRSLIHSNIRHSYAMGVNRRLPGERRRQQPCVANLGLAHPPACWSTP
jgi:hypothetical protein